MDICDLAPMNCGLKPGNSLLSQHNGTGPILVNDVKRVLTNIDAAYGAPAFRAVPASERPDHPTGDQAAYARRAASYHKPLSGDG